MTETPANGQQKPVRPEAWIVPADLLDMVLGVLDGFPYRQVSGVIRAIETQIKPHLPPPKPLTNEVGLTEREARAFDGIDAALTWSSQHRAAIQADDHFTHVKEFDELEKILLAALQRPPKAETSTPVARNPEE